LTTSIAAILNPEDYGLIAMAMVFQGFANVFIDMGFSAALIQSKDTSNEDYSSVFWLNLCVGCVLQFIYIIAADDIAGFFNEPRLESVVFWLSFNFIIVALSLVHRAMLKRKLRFKSIALVNIISMFLSGIIALGLAIQGLGYWSLVLQLILLAVFRSIGYIACAKWYPALIFNVNSIKRNWAYSKSLLATSIIGFWAKQLDKLLIGKEYMSADLGLYRMAFTYSFNPIIAIKKKLGDVLFSALSRVQDQRSGFNSLLHGVVSLTSLVLFPVILVIALLSDLFILQFLGAQWSEVIPYLQIMCLATLFAIPVYHIHVFNAIGRTDLTLKVNLICHGIRIGLLFVSLFYGELKYVVYAFLAQELINGLIRVVVSYRICGASLRVFFLDQLHIILICLIIAIPHLFFIYMKTQVAYRLSMLLITLFLYAALVFYTRPRGYNYFMKLRGVE